MSEQKAVTVSPKNAERLTFYSQELNRITHGRAYLTRMIDIKHYSLCLASIWHYETTGEHLPGVDWL